MTKKITILLILILSTVSTCYARYTSGYTRSNGTYVRPYYRTKSDGYRYNNYSYKYNYNPNTNRRGTRSYTPRYNYNTRKYSPSY